MAGKKNPNFKKPNSVTEYSLDQVKELVKCMNSPIYFAENYVKIQHPKKGLVPLELYDFQKRMLDAYQNQRYCVTLASRQVGKCSLGSTKISVVKRTPLNFSLINILRRLILRILDYEKYKQIYKNVP